MELLKLAVILALWAAVAGAFVSVLYRRQSDADQSRIRDLKLVYDLQLDREILARREYELTVESQLRRELASELRAQAADDLAELRAELSALRTSLEILFDTDLGQRPALGAFEGEPQPERAYSEWERNGENPRDTPVDWVPSDRVTSAPQEHPPGRHDETAIIDVPEEPLMPPRPQQPAPPRRERPRYHAPPGPTEPRFEPRYQPPPAAAATPPPPETPPEPPREPQPQQQGRDWQPVGAEGQWLPPGSPGSNWAGADAESTGGRRRARHSGADEAWDGMPVEPVPPPPYAESGRRARSRHSAEYRDYGVRNFAPGSEPPAGPDPAPPPPVATTPPPAPSGPAAGAPPPPRLAPPPAAEHTPRHGGEPEPADPRRARDASDTGGQSVADLLARLQVQPSEGGRRRRREG
ncbi:putative transmembrane protein [Mycobacterium lepraemurium]|nr:putative transmembrane protein [Mycobacterium lepraemurium]